MISSGTGPKTFDDPAQLADAYGKQIPPDNKFTESHQIGLMRTVRARASWGLTGITMIDYAAVVSYLRKRPRRKDRPVCGAKTRAGRPCRMRVEFGKARCRLHGGLSTGPKTEAGRARIAEAQRRRWRDYREKAAGDVIS
jgi:hypothetical protein